MIVRFLWNELATVAVKMSALVFLSMKHVSVTFFQTTRLTRTPGLYRHCGMSPFVSILTRFHCTSFTSVIDRQAYSLVIVSEFETLAVLANYICFTRWCPQSNHLK